MTKHTEGYHLKDDASHEKHTVETYEIKRKKLEQMHLSAFFLSVHGVSSHFEIKVYIFLCRENDNILGT